MVLSDAPADLILDAQTLLRVIMAKLEVEMSVVTYSTTNGKATELWFVEANS